MTGTLISLSGSIVRTKWKSLRDNFRRELQKKPHPRSGDDGFLAGWKSPWKYFESLHFLQDQFTPRVAGGSLPEINDSLTTDSPGEGMDEPPPTESEEAQMTTPTCSSVDSREASGSAPRKRRRPTDEIGSALIRIEERKLKMLENNRTQVPKVVDEDVAFFDSLLPHVKSLPPTEKLLLRIKMQQLVYDFVRSKECPNQLSTFHQQYSSLPPTQPPFQRATPEYSNPGSVASYLSNFSHEQNDIE